MSNAAFESLEETYRSRGAAATIDRLIDDLRDQKKHHALFDALLMKKRHELGLGLTRPAGLRDVPEPIRDDFERYYIDTAREVGRMLLAEGAITQGWHYFRAIGESEPVARAIEALPDDAQTSDEIVDIALIQGLAPVKGLKLYLASHGTCSTITAFDQQYMRLAPEFRRQCASVLVRSLYDDLRANVAHDVERRGLATPADLSLRELIAGRDELFADDAYHIDVSHLNSIVRFGRALDRESPELNLALQMAEYGSRLAPQYQYAGNPPFDEFYPAHIRFFHVLLGKDADAALDYFRAKLGPEVADPDNQTTAFVIVDLLLRLGRRDEALELACRYLAGSAEEFGLSLPELCAEAGRFDLLKSISQNAGDLIHYTAALLSAGNSSGKNAAG